MIIYLILWLLRTGSERVSWRTRYLIAMALADLDFWLRSDGHRRNPGTTADLIAAGLFAALREHQIALPFRWGK